MDYLDNIEVEKVEIEEEIRRACDSSEERHSIARLLTRKTYLLWLKFYKKFLKKTLARYPNAMDVLKNSIQYYLWVTNPDYFDYIHYHICNDVREEVEWARKKTVEARAV